MRGVFGWLLAFVDHLLVVFKILGSIFVDRQELEQLVVLNPDTCLVLTRQPIGNLYMPRFVKGDESSVKQLVLKW